MAHFKQQKDDWKLQAGQVQMKSGLCLQWVPKHSTWWLYRFRAFLALGIRRSWSVSSCKM